MNVYFHQVSNSKDVRLFSLTQSFLEKMENQPSLQRLIEKVSFILSHSQVSSLYKILDRGFLLQLVIEKLRLKAHFRLEVNQPKLVLRVMDKLLPLQEINQRIEREETFQIHQRS